MSTVVSCPVLSTVYHRVQGVIKLDDHGGYCNHLQISVHVVHVCCESVCMDIVIDTFKILLCALSIKLIIICFLYCVKGIRLLALT